MFKAYLALFCVISCINMSSCKIFRPCELRNKLKLLEKENENKILKSKIMLEGFKLDRWVLEALESKYNAQEKKIEKLMTELAVYQARNDSSESEILKKQLLLEEYERERINIRNEIRLRRAKNDVIEAYIEHPNRGGKIEKEFLQIENALNGRSLECLATRLSALDTSANISGHLGLFGIGNEWCRSGEPGGYCDIKCSDLVNDDISDDVICAQLIYSSNGTGGWATKGEDCFSSSTDLSEDCHDDVKGEFQTNGFKGILLKRLQTMKRITNFTILIY